MPTRQAGAPRYVVDVRLRSYLMSPKGLARRPADEPLCPQGAIGPLRGGLRPWVHWRHWGWTS